MALVWWLWFPVVGAMIWLVLHIGDSWFTLIEDAGARFASNQRLVVLAIFLTAILLRIALLWAVPIPTPEVHDEFSYLLQADTFLHERLANPPHPMWIYLDTFHVLQHPTYASIFPPAQGAVLALGQVLGSPWIGVLLSAAIMCAAMTWMLQGWLPPRWALVGAVLIILRICLGSYWLDSYWGGAVAAIGGALVMGAFPRILKRQCTKDALLMGIGIALLANSRPLEGFLFCVPIAVALLVWLFSRRSPSFAVTGPRLLLPLLPVVGMTLLFILYDNWRVTNNPFLFPHTLYDQQYINYRVFRWQRLKPPLTYLNPQFDDYFNGWVRQTFSPSWQLLWEEGKSWWHFFVGTVFTLPLMALPWVVRDRRARFPVVVLAWCVLGLLPVFFFEPHYAAPMAAAFFIVLVQAMRHLRRWELKGRPIGIFLTRVVVALLLFRAFAVTANAYLHPVLDWSTYRARMVKQLEANPGKHLVIVRYAPDHFVHGEWVYNGADIDGSKIVWAREIPQTDMTPLLNYFRDRKVWLVEADRRPPMLENYSGSAPEPQVPGH